MGLLGTILGAGTARIICGVGKIFDDLHTSDEERLAAQAKKDKLLVEVERMLHEERQAEEETIQKTIEARMQVIVTELKQGSVFVKSARPSIVYTGLLIMLWTAIAPTFGAAPVVMPDMFWISWSGVTGAYAIGRSAEKRGSDNKVTQLMAGKQPKIETGL